MPHVTEVTNKVKHKKHEQRLQYFYDNVKGGWIENRPFFMDDFEYKKSVLVRNGFLALDHIKQTRDPTEHTGLLMDYVKCLVRIQKSEWWVANFECSKKTKHYRRCKARPIPTIDKRSAAVDKDVEKFFKSASSIIGEKVIRRHHQVQKENEIGNMEVNVKRTATGGIVFEIIQE